MINKTKQQATPLDLAINAAGGSQKILAERIGVTPQAINMLKKRGGNLPVSKMRKYAEVTGLPKETLYPNLFPNN